MKIIDTRGKKCPMPLIQTKKALIESTPGESIRILIDNHTSVKNVTHYLEDNGIPVVSVQAGDTWELTVNRGEESMVESKPEDYCETPDPVNKSYVVLFAKDRIGEGSVELGTKLIGSMLESLKAQDVLPEKMIFMNSGIHLVTEGSEYLQYLVELELNGVELIACGTCLNYYGKSEGLSVGRVSNMFEIMEVMRKSGTVISI